jgi:superfamily I DNA/RNA helicase
MITRAFIGAAGTGKTTKLLSEVEAHLVGNPLSEGQRVLALTFMHGSRFRLIERLSKSSIRRRFECLTFDRFAWELCRRWRSRLKMIGISLPVDVPAYDATCDAAGQLLSFIDVVKWIASRYPVLLVDEFQDCTAVRLAIAQKLHGQVALFLAADDFQNLTSTEESPAVVWLGKLGVIEELTINHRTQVSELLSAAHTLRHGGTVSNGTAFKLLGLPKAAPAASFVSQTIAGYSPKDAVILSPARLEGSAWVREIVDLVGQNQYGNQKAGPFSIHWEKTTEEIETETISQLGLTGDPTTQVQAASVRALAPGRVAKRLVQWIEHQRQVLGRTSFSGCEIRSQVRRAVQHIRSIQSSHGGRRAMTIHQAKNREFPIVIVLWSFALPPDAQQARRWLYNAVTRAKKRAIVLVQDPKKSRLSRSPFV